MWPWGPVWLQGRGHRRGCLGSGMARLAQCRFSRVAALASPTLHSCRLSGIPGEKCRLQAGRGLCRTAVLSQAGRDAVSSGAQAVHGDQGQSLPRRGPRPVASTEALGPCCCLRHSSQKRTLTLLLLHSKPPKPQMWECESWPGDGIYSWSCLTLGHTVPHTCSSGQGPASPLLLAEEVTWTLPARTLGCPCRSLGE